MLDAFLKVEKAEKVNKTQSHQIESWAGAPLSKAPKSLLRAPGLCVCSLLVCKAAGAPFWLLLDLEMNVQMSAESKRSILDLKKKKRLKINSTK